MEGFGVSYFVTSGARSWAGAADPDGLAARAADALVAARARASADRHEMATIALALDDPPTAVVPALEDDPVEVAGLARVTRALEGR